MGEDADQSRRFQGSRVVVLGLARQGMAVARYLCGLGAQVTVSDRASESALGAEIAQLSELPIEFALGGHPVELLDHCDLVVVSGGVPPLIPFVQEAVARGIPLSNDALLTLQAASEDGLGPIIGITGSSGKTTTTTLVGEMLAGRTAVHVGGNIGTPLVDRMDTIGKGEPIVLELSSFQLELFDEALTKSPISGVGPHYGAITNITPNHLDRHPSMADYAAAKLNLIDAMPAGSLLVLNRDDAVTGTLAAGDGEGGQLGPHTEVPQEWGLTDLLNETMAVLTHRRIEIAPYSVRQPLVEGAWLEEDRLMVDGELICRRSEVLMRGEHNVSNLLAAALLSRRAGADLSSIAHVAKHFKGVAHRLEVVSTEGGITWVNDSIATAPERALAALRSFDEPGQIIILLAGGKDKNLPWESFAAEVIRRVSFLIGFGESGAMIVNHVQEQARFGQIQAPGCASVTRLDEAVALASKIATPGAVVLLSPGGTSFDAYKNFEARGEHFRRLVRQLAGEEASAGISRQETHGGGYA
ncbi:MAG: UDP-N-acetylmuramoyl-L-alanine--D-glutamate ligase [Caldilineaceae bacterium]